MSAPWQRKLEQWLEPLPAKHWELLRARLTQSAFRRQFRLRGAEAAYVRRVGLIRLGHQAWELIGQRLAPALVENDGRQTPYRGHPVFVAQHATATCCRKCLARWHAIEPNIPLTEKQQRYIVAVLLRFVLDQLGPADRTLATGQQRELFE